MAILENKKNYYKIYYEECYIKNNTVYVCVDIYDTAEDRLREKEHIENFQVELEKLRIQLDVMKEGFMLKLPQDLVDDNTENSDFDKHGIIKIPEFREEHERLTNLQNAISFVYSHIYKTHDVSHINFNILSDYDIDMTLVEQPINVNRGLTVANGDYNQEALTTEFFYNQLKTVMNTDLIEDC